MKPLLSIVLLLAFAAARAQHAERCEPIPKEEWRVKIENGCYEVYGRDAKGNRRETFFHPKTFEVITAPDK